MASRASMLEPQGKRHGLKWSKHAPKTRCANASAAREPSVDGRNPFRTASKQWLKPCGIYRGIIMPVGCCRLSPKDSIPVLTWAAPENCHDLNKKGSLPTSRYLAYRKNALGTQRILGSSVGHTPPFLRVCMNPQNAA